MTPRRAIYGTIAKSTYLRNSGPLVTGIDLAQLLSRILFFDEVIVRSIRMGELPFLIKVFGANGLEELLTREVESCLLTPYRLLPTFIEMGNASFRCSSSRRDLLT
jgi:hypothetical protein